MILSNLNRIIIVAPTSSFDRKLVVN